MYIHYDIMNKSGVTAKFGPFLPITLLWVKGPKLIYSQALDWFVCLSVVIVTAYW